MLVGVCVCVCVFVDCICHFLTFSKSFMFTEHFRESKTVTVFTARHDNLGTGAVRRPFVFDIYKLFYFSFFYDSLLFLRQYQTFTEN